MTTAGARPTTSGLKHDDTAWCWGDNMHGCLGDGTKTASNVPVQVVNISNVAVVSAGCAHTCAVITGGGAWCWGANGGGRLGDGTITESVVPVQVTDPYQ